MYGMRLKISTKIEIFISCLHLLMYNVVSHSFQKSSLFCIKKQQNQYPMIKQLALFDL